jgi:nickel superoxide dismutase
MKRSTLTRFCLLTMVASPFFGSSAFANAPGSPTTAAVTVANPAPAPVPHCEVPCGIYADQMRFQMMLEDTATIAKAIGAVNEFASSLEAGPSAKDINQATRWVMTKEDHATKVQHVMAQYFLTQRIKADHKEYTGQLATAHRVIVAAMKCKQDADPATAEALKKAIYDFYRAYEGKEPAFEKEQK